MERRDTDITVDAVVTIRHSEIVLIKRNPGMLRCRGNFIITADFTVYGLRK